MKPAHQSFLDMCLRLKRHYWKHEKVLDHYKGMPQLRQRLVFLTDTLDINFEKSITYELGYNIERAKKRGEIQLLCLDIGKTLFDIQKSIKYKITDEVKNFIFLDEIELSLLDDKEIIVYTSSLLDLSHALSKKLSQKPGFEKKKDKLISNLTLFTLVYPGSQKGVEERKEANLLAIKAIDDINALLSEKYDAAMSLLSGKHPEIYVAYQKAREVKDFDENSKADYEGVLTDIKLNHLGSLKYDRDREFRVLVEGGDVIWGLSRSKDQLEYSRPARPIGSIRVKSRIIAPDGLHLLIQAVLPKQNIKYKIWVS